MRLKAALISFTVVVLSALAGCNGVAADKKILTIDFQEGQTLQYKFVSSREIDVELDTTKNASKPDKGSASKSSESMEMVISYTPLEVNPYGLTTIKAACNSVKVTRSKGQSGRAARKDAVENLAGKTFTFTVGPTGKMEDNSQLEKLIQEIGQKAFREDKGQVRVKEPDMINDFIASQWFLWDSVSSIKSTEGLSIGQTWQSKLSVPTPMILRKARDVTYRLDEIRQSQQGQLAVIHSSYKLAESVPKGWPIPYSGRFEVAGPFGFYINYEVLDLQGEGEELFNIDKGRIEQYNQQYQMQLKASLQLPLPGVNPRINIKQNLTMQLLE